jgi:hypothetical protein
LIGALLIRISRRSQLKPPQLPLRAELIDERHI